jgi:Family of unknown function (DUF6072)
MTEDEAVSPRRSTKLRTRKRATAQEESEMATRTTDSNVPLKTGLAFASECVIPGGSNLLTGNYAQAALHAGLGILAGAFFGLPGVIVVAANSFTKSTTGQSLYESLNFGSTADDKT